MFDVKVNVANACKSQGNDAFKAKEFVKARAAYEQALKVLALPHECSWSSKEADIVYELLSVLHANLAACYLQNNFTLNKCAHHCNEALRFNETNVKALYRRCQAFSRAGHFENAMRDIAAAIELDPGNPLLRNEAKRVRSLFNSKISTEKQLYKRAFA